MGWLDFNDNDEEKVRERERENGELEYLHIYKDEALAREAEAARGGHGGHDHVVFDNNGNVKYDSTKDEPSDDDLARAYGYDHYDSSLDEPGVS